MDNRIAYVGIALLLIVPYGIETSIFPDAVELKLTFNCTLWN